MSQRGQLLAVGRGGQVVRQRSSTVTDALAAQKARSLASAAKEQAFSEALVAATTLAFASGELGSARSVPALGR